MLAVNIVNDYKKEELIRLQGDKIHRQNLVIAEMSELLEKQAERLCHRPKAPITLIDVNAGIAV